MLIPLLFQIKVNRFNSGFFNDDVNCLILIYNYILLNKRCLVLYNGFYNKVNVLNDNINAFSMLICLVEHAI
jgi:hypothetical protein